MRKSRKVSQFTGLGQARVGMEMLESIWFHFVQFIRYLYCWIQNIGIHFPTWLREALTVYRNRKFEIIQTVVGGSLKKIIDKFSNPQRVVLKKYIDSNFFLTFFYFEGFPLTIKSTRNGMEVWRMLSELKFKVQFQRLSWSIHGNRFTVCCLVILLCTVKMLNVVTSSVHCI